MGKIRILLNLFILIVFLAIFNINPARKIEVEERLTVGQASKESEELAKKSKSEEKKEEKIEAFPEVKKINDDLYVGKVKDKNNNVFYLAMERINYKNIDMWLEYAINQEKEGLIISQTANKYLPTADGSAFFKKVLLEYKYEIIKPQNELWVAYASRVPVTQKAKLNIKEVVDRDENPDIEMFVTVITSPNALITSHMGISRTVEAAEDLLNRKRINHPDQSIDLHSFAAKVIKKLDAKKKYMLTAPAIAMRNILIAKMPKDSVFVGDNLYKMNIETVQKNPSILLHAVELKERKGETEIEKEKRVQEMAQARYSANKINEKIALLKSNPPRINRVKDGDKQQFTIQKSDGSPLVTFDQLIYINGYLQDLI